MVEDQRKRCRFSYLNNAIFQPFKITRQRMEVGQIETALKLSYRVLDEKQGAENDAK